jgi:hypothetical protein
MSGPKSLNQALNLYTLKGDFTWNTRVSVPSSELAPIAPSTASECLSPLDLKGQTHSLLGKGAGGANSDDWRESLTLCLL